jgi:hypothetical protein
MYCGPLGMKRTQGNFQLSKGITQDTFAQSRLHLGAPEISKGQADQLSAEKLETGACRTLRRPIATSVFILQGSAFE